jgi:hypothetical protein
MQLVFLIIPRLVLLVLARLQITTVYEGGTNTNISATGFSITTRGLVTILFIDTQQ